MVSPEKLQKKLREFNLQGYTDSNVKYSSNKKDGKILTRESGKWRYEDEFYGGEPYSGNETVWFDNNIVFRCVYWGKVAEDIDFGNIYDFLRKALKEGPNGKCVHRGPESFKEEGLEYTNYCEGNIEEFVQTERILINDKEVYIARFVGGRVNVQQ